VIAILVFAIPILLLVVAQLKPQRQAEVLERKFLYWSKQLPSWNGMSH
jgi:hypothetical protein